MQKDVLHLITTSNFFDKIIVESFEKIYPHNNDYIFSGNKKNPELENYLSFREKKFLEINTAKYKLVFIHHLNFYKALLINRMPEDIKVIWICWGADAFDLPVFRKQFLSEKTMKNFRIIYLKDIFIEHLQNLHKLIFYRKNKYQVIYKAINRTNYIATLLPGDFELIKAKLDSTAIELPFNYFNTETFFQTNKAKHFLNYNILFGNSVTLTNNHIDVFEILLTKKKIPGKIIVPLVHGDKWLRAKIIKKFKNKFPTEIEFLTKRLPSESYYELIGSCGITIMNHYRQQALGNILPMIGFGSKLFLSRRGQLYKYLKSKNFFVFTIEEDLIQENAFDLLSENQILHNINCLKEIRPPNDYKNNLKHFVDLL